MASSRSFLLIKSSILSLICSTVFDKPSTLSTLDLKVLKVSVKSESDCILFKLLLKESKLQKFSLPFQVEHFLILPLRHQKMNFDSYRKSLMAS